MEQLRALKPRFLFYSHGPVGKDPENLISTAVDNTRIIGDVILDALKTQENEEAIIRNVGDYIWNRFGVRLDEWELVSNVKGYIHYFRKQQDL